ncbi:tetratricopeptide repeat protein [Rhodoferax lacus]|uniref:tetratricopeptide repeat protein n=1 Tax=Rhodoferax lacus TaxID=2184758 RepID=UPI000E3BF584|nr:tetratricopeptide repeat protein [Rhodoferax lacus]
MAKALTPDTILAQAQASLSQGRSAQALQIITEALQQTPDHPALWAGLGVALRFEARLDDAADAFEKALQLQPGRADVQVHLGMIRLAQGRQDEGWPLYQARWRSPHWTERLRYPAQALWQGRVSAGMRLLLWGEQGFGDSLQFARYAPWLQQEFKAHGATVVLEVPKPLQHLLQQSWPALEVAAAGELHGHFDAHLPLMDLPNRWGGVGPGLLPYLPMPVPYLSLPPAGSASIVGSQYAPSRAGSGGGTGAHANASVLKVGVVWQGRPTHPDDRLRSLSAATLQPLFDLPGLSWVSLQKDAKDLPAWLPDSMALCADFSETARVVQALDVVVSIDSAVAHLAAALGKPVFLLLPQVADWRWGLSGERTPWYPNVHLFRRGAGDSWAVVMARVAQALADLRRRVGHAP